MRSVPLLLVLAACGSGDAFDSMPRGGDRAAPDDGGGFLSRGSVYAADGVIGVSLQGDGDYGVISMDGMTCRFDTARGTTNTDEDVLPDEGDEVVVDSRVDGTDTTALLLAGDRLVRADAAFLYWASSETGVDHVVTAKLLADGFVALRDLDEGCAVDFWRWTEQGAEAYGGAWTDACDAGALAADPETGRAWAVAGGKLVEVTAEGAVPLDVPAERVAWDAAADALYTTDGDVLGAWEADGTPRWSARRVDARGLVAMPALGVAVVRVPDGAHGRLVAYDGITGARLHDVGLTSADGALVAAPEGRVVAAIDGPNRVESWELR